MFISNCLRGGLAVVVAVAVYSSAVEAATYYVAPSASGGSDGNPGSLASPFLTIQRAANVAVSGDTVFVRAGTYRETITPAGSGASAASPITFQPYNGESVTISGAEVLTGWSLDTGSIYKAPLVGSFFTSTMNQSLQVFVDGNMMTLAKWPNMTTATKAYPSGVTPAVDVSHPSKSVITSFVSKTRNAATNTTTGVVGDTALPAKAAGFYDGAQIFFQPNNAGWSWAFSGVVTGVPANGNQITFTSRNDSGQDGASSVYQIGSRYYLFNKKEFLDAPGEWWHDTVNGQLYLQTPASDNPAGHTVEVKKRDYAFNLTNRNYITVKGFNLFACTITTDTSAGGDAIPYDASGNPRYPWRGANNPVAPSTGVVIDGIDARYLNHFTDVSGHFYMQWGMGSGIVLSGTGHTLRNSHLQYAAGNGLNLVGNGHTVYNNLIEDTDYSAVECSPICVLSADGVYSADHEIAYNTVVRAARSGITPRNHANSNAAGGSFKARIHHNTVSQFGIQDWDVGALYIGSTDGKFLRIDHNQFSEGVGYTASGVYIDFGKNFIVDHNVVWNVEWGIKLQGSNNGLNNTLVYNNTVAVRNTSSASYGPFAIGNGSGTNVGTVLKNNLLSCNNLPSAGYQSITSGAYFSGSEIASNIAWDGVANSSTDPKFVNRATTLGATGVDYRIQTGSAAIDTGGTVGSYTRDGVVVPPFPDTSSGAAPDAGAYEYGSLPWAIGADTTRCTGPAMSPWPGVFTKSTTITLSTLTPGATIRYTIDGSTPTGTSGTIYTGPFTISSTATVKAISTAPGLADSTVANGFYTIIIPPALGAPLGFSAMATSSTSVFLTWTDNASAETGYTLERRTGAAGEWAVLADLASNTVSYVDATALPATEYSYRARAYNNGGATVGSYGGEALVITPGTFTSPGTLSVTQVTGTTAIIPVQINNVASSTQTFSIPALSSGYGVVSSSQSGGPAFDWNDIGATGNLIAEMTPTDTVSPDDVLSAAINLGFSFPFYGNSFSSVKVCSNGFLTFTGSYYPYVNTTLPSAPGSTYNVSQPNMIAFLWDDLRFTSTKSSRAYYRSYDSSGQGGFPDTFVVQFTNVVLFSNPTGGTTTLQVVLKKDGRIFIYYLNCDLPTATYTIGINNADGTKGVQVAFNQTYVTPTLAVLIAPTFGLSASPSSLTLAAGASGTIQVTVNSTGFPLGLVNSSLSFTSDLVRQPTFTLPVSLTIASANPSVPATPGSFAVTPGGTYALLSWGDVASETSYKLERSPDGISGWNQIAWLGQSTTSYRDSGLIAGLSYYYRLRANNVGGDSAYTSVIRANVGFSGLQSWLLGYSLPTDGNGDGADMADPDGDGVCNLLEYALGGDPTVANTALMPSVQLGADKLQISFLCDSSKTDITYTVQASSDLVNWFDIASSSGGAVTIAVNASGATISDTASGVRTVFITDAASLTLSARRFLRLKVSRL